MTHENNFSSLDPVNYFSEHQKIEKDVINLVHFSTEYL